MKIWLRNMLALVCAFIGIATAQAEPATLIRGARVFDGTGAPAKLRDVLVRGDRIVAVARRISARDAEIVDASGMTLIPGLHDLHIHTPRAAFENAETLAATHRPYLASGVTSVNEYSVSGPMLAPIRAIETSALVEAPHMVLAIRLGVPHGHGTESEFTNSITTQVTTPAEARAAMERLLPYRPGVIKVFADGWRYARDADLPDMDLPTLKAIVDAAHADGIRVVTHTVTLAGAKIAARAGVDALVHGVGDALVDRELIRLMKKHRTSYVPTLAVYEPQQDRRLLPAEWSRLRPRDLERETQRRAEAVQPIRDYESKRWQIMQDNVRLLHAAGIRIGIGTDTGIGGVYPGLAAQREIRLLTTLGFTPREALAAATTTSARIMGARNHGRIARGQRADLVLVAGRPDEQIEDLYQVRRTWVSGRAVSFD
ncbi:amidohydrolase family protein [Sphingomonas cavernae]|uniref:Amidohydrolase-related domain-containing protein n=1 Tax=Sphingomonas cavernae TaxID=2320861 RepID=A0A418WKQ2_9SPHN|nr:amidohydrolase family protein [Sphingomonas cavernae]RJF90621.1 hypothetical protein D3876_10385 [Sphingomonas cavernae]